MFVVVGKNGYGVKVLDTDDGVVEGISYLKLRDVILSGIRVYGVEVRPEFGDGCDVFLNFGEARDALKSCGINPSKYGI